MVNAELLFSAYPEIDFCRVQSSSITKTCPKEEEKRALKGKRNGRGKKKDNKKQFSKLLKEEKV